MSGRCPAGCGLLCCNLFSSYIDVLHSKNNGMKFVRYDFTLYTEHTEKGTLNSVMLVLHVILIHGLTMSAAGLG